MARTVETRGDTWEAYVGQDAPHPGTLPLIFHCTTNLSHGYRVVEVPADEFEREGKLTDLEQAELERLFERAQPFDFTHDPKSKENTVGQTPLR